MEVNVRPPKHHYDLIYYHCVSKLAYFVEHDIGYQPSRFQCSRMPGSNFMERGGSPSDTTRLKSPVFVGLKCRILKYLIYSEM